jgi:hypothetical protein
VPDHLKPFVLAIRGHRCGTGSEVLPVDVQVSQLFEVGPQIATVPVLMLVAQHHGAIGSNKIYSYHAWSVLCSLSMIISPSVDAYQERRIGVTPTGTPRAFRARRSRYCAELVSSQTHVSICRGALALSRLNPHLAGVAILPTTRRHTRIAWRLIAASRSQ